MAKRSHSQNRRALTQKSNQTDGRLGRQKMVRSESGEGSGLVDSKTRPPSQLEQVYRKLGERIQTLREQRGLSRQRLGNDCGLSTTKMKRIETGSADAGLFAIIHLAARLETNLANLFEGVA